METEMAMLSLDNPVFVTYMITAGIMLLKLMLQPWMTVYRMMKVRAGFRSPEDAQKSLINPTPSSDQLKPNEYVERSRRMNLNDLESIPGFLLAGFLFVLTGPSLLLAQLLMWGYVIARAAHFMAYSTAQLHDIRATCWTLSSLPVLAMAAYALLSGLSA
ncbi:MAPEG family protein [Halomonas aquatica]|uniref:Microsomal glutathione S-transferase 1 n=1 Tax=Halomonas aquatica TaxID=3151123 RepID=A0ABV1NGJ9_9GAMM